MARKMKTLYDVTACAKALMVLLVADYVVVLKRALSGSLTILVF